MASALAACGGSDRFIPGPTTASTPVENLTKDDFTNLVGQVVPITHPIHGTGAVTLTTCDDLSATYPPGTGERDPFRLAWNDASSFAIEDGIYTFAHPDHGTLELFLFRTSGTSFDVHFN